MPTPTLRTDTAAATPLPTRLAEVLEIVHARTALLARARSDERLATTSADDALLRRFADHAQAEVARRLRIGERTVEITVPTGQTSVALPGGLGSIERAAALQADPLGQIVPYDLVATDGATLEAASSGGIVTGMRYGVRGGRLLVSPSLTSAGPATIRLYVVAGTLLGDDGDLVAMPEIEVGRLLSLSVLAQWYDAVDARADADRARLDVEALIGERPVHRHGPRTASRGGAWL